MSTEPGVDAGDVEGVAAPRQHPELLPGGQVGQADGALLLQLMPFFHCCDGERVDGLLLQASGRKRQGHGDAIAGER